MSWFWTLLADERGFVVSAETALVTTLGVMGASVGLESVSESVNSELFDLGAALRGLNQSYSIPERRSGRAFVARSSFQQPARQSDEQAQLADQVSIHQSPDFSDDLRGAANLVR